jgi:hypothetical protein
VARVSPSIGVRVPTGHLASAAGLAAAATSVISPLVSKRHNPAVIAPKHRRNTSATAPPTSDGSTPRATSVPTRRAGRLLGNELAILGVQRDIVGRIIELPDRRFVGG